MDDRNPLKAYYNREFLSSPDARAIRIQCEFQEPFSRLNREKIKSTIVFFGSARFKPLDELKPVIADLEQRLAAGEDDPGLEKELKRMQRLVPMASYYDEARELARLLTSWAKTLNNGNELLLCSGGAGGIMEAANRGAHDAGGKSLGFNISLPMEQHSNKYITDDYNFEFHYFFMRKFWFLILAKALVVFPGGYGTLDELMEVLTLVQTQKVANFPVVLYGTDYWKSMINFERMIESGVINEEDMDIFKFADSPEEAYSYLHEKLTEGFCESLVTDP